MTLKIKGPPILDGLDQEANRGLGQVSDDPFQPFLPCLAGGRHLRAEDTHGKLDVGPRVGEVEKPPNCFTGFLCLSRWQITAVVHIQERSVRGSISALKVIVQTPHKVPAVGERSDTGLRADVLPLEEAELVVDIDHGVGELDLHFLPQDLLQIFTFCPA